MQIEADQVDIESMSTELKELNQSVEDDKKEQETTQHEIWDHGLSTPAIIGFVIIGIVSLVGIISLGIFVTNQLSKYEEEPADGEEHHYEIEDEEEEHHWYDFVSE